MKELRPENLETERCESFFVWLCRKDSIQYVNVFVLLLMIDGKTILNRILNEDVQLCGRGMKVFSMPNLHFGIFFFYIMQSNDKGSSHLSAVDPQCVRDKNVLYKLQCTNYSDPDWMSFDSLKHKKCLRHNGIEKNEGIISLEKQKCTSKRPLILM